MGIINIVEIIKCRFFIVMEDLYVRNKDSYRDVKQHRMLARIPACLRSADIVFFIHEKKIRTLRIAGEEKDYIYLGPLTTPSCMIWYKMKTFLFDPSLCFHFLTTSDPDLFGTDINLKLC